MSNVEASDIYREVLQIKRDVESVKHQTSWLLRGQASAVSGHWEKVFGIIQGKKRRYNRMKVYLATDGRRSVKEVAAIAGVHEQDAGKWLSEMEKHQLVGLVPQKKNNKIYEKSPIDFALGISEKLRHELDQKLNGAKGEDE